MRFQHALMLSALAVLGMQCSKPTSPSRAGLGTISIRLNIDLNSLPSLSTPLPPDLRTFTLDILQADQLIERFSPLGDAVRSVNIEAGLYELHCYSAPFTVPAFEQPIYGAHESVRVVASSTVSATINCAQTNAGVNIVYDDKFQTSHTTYSTRITQGDHSLDYVGPNLLRTGYFLADNVVLEVTADGKLYQESLRLNPRSIYTLTIQDGPITGGTKGDIQVNINVSTDVIQEEIMITLPNSDSGGGSENSDKLPYFENMGDIPVGNHVLLSLYTGWQNANAQYGYSIANTPSMQSSQQSISYADCSGGNSVALSKNGYFEVSGLETADYGNLAFSFGCRSQLGTFHPDDLLISVSSDGLTYTPLEYMCNESESWELVTIDYDIPSCNNLRIRMCALSSTIVYIDDLHLNGISFHREE